MGNQSGTTTLPKSSRNSRLCSSSTVLSAEGINLETFLLIWLDPHVDTNDENRMTQTFLRKILTCLVTFDDIETCEKWLKECDTNAKIILIVSGAYGEKIVPKIHYLSTIISIYIYCLDVKRNERWAKNYPKIRSVASNPEVLVKQLSMNQTNLERVEDSKALQIYSLDIKTASYIWYQLLLDVLLSSNYLSSKTTPLQLTALFRKYIGDNDDYGLKLISEFEETYRPYDAVSWLIRDAPLGRFVNKALREQDIHRMFVLRFLLIDIYNQLMKHQEDSINAFRIQPMMKSQMENLSAHPGQLLVVNGFLFASTNRDQLINSITNNDQFEIVLMDITAKYRPGVAPFAFLRDIDCDIKGQSDQEILFMCGSIFQVGSLINKNSIWTLELTLVKDSDISSLFSMKQELRKNHNLCLIGNLLNHCNQSDKAIIYYEELLRELPKQHELVPQINKELCKKNTASMIDVQCILINLSSCLTEFATAMLDMLRSLTPDAILIYENKLTSDFSQWSDQPMSLFTTAHFAESLENLPKCCTVFTLENDKSKVNQQCRFATIEDLISQIADEIVRQYRLKAKEYHKAGKLDKAEQQEEAVNRIYRELTRIHKKFTTNNTSEEILNTIEPSLVLLIPRSEDMNYIEKYFGDYFSSYHFFHNKNRCHQFIVEHENANDMFIIIHIRYEQTIVTSLRQFSNVKYVYYYGKAKETDEKIFQNQEDLHYRLTYDLIGYYGELGDKYQTNNQPKTARDIFLKGQKLCQFLSEHFFLN